jgi:Phosphotransferase enzyme family
VNPVPPDEAEVVFGTIDVELVEPLRIRPLGATVGVWRVRSASSTAVLKLLRHEKNSNQEWATSADPSHPRWWRRELATFTAGIPELLLPELRPPRMLHAAERPDGSLALWFEDLGPRTQWSVEGLVDVARRLGAVQGRVALALPASPARGFLRAYVEPRAPYLVEPFATRREEILAHLDAGTQTICHHDPHPTNLLSLSGWPAVVDWDYCGLGPLGADAGVLAFDAILEGLVPFAEAEAFADEIWNTYHASLGDEQMGEEAARAYALGTALRFAWFPARLEGRYGNPLKHARRIAAAAAYQTFNNLASSYL